MRLAAAPSGRAGPFVATRSKPWAWTLAPVAVWITVATATIIDGAVRYGW